MRYKSQARAQKSLHSEPTSENDDDSDAMDNYKSDGASYDISTMDKGRFNSHVREC